MSERETPSGKKAYLFFPGAADSKDKKPAKKKKKEEEEMEAESEEISVEGEEEGERQRNPHQERRLELKRLFFQRQLQVLRLKFPWVP